jgi:hypothetical protein
MILFTSLRSSHMVGSVACRVSPRRARYFSLLRQRKVPKRKATLVSVTPAAPGQPAVLDLAGVCANSPCGLKHAQPLIRPSLRSSAHTQGWGAGTENPQACVPVVFGLGSADSHRRVRRRVAQERAEKGARMFERSEFARTPPGPSNAACPALQRRDDAPGSPFFAYFLWRDKESEAPAGARPGKASEPWCKQKEVSQTC